MKKPAFNNYGRNLTAIALLWAMFIMPLAAFAQTRIPVPKTKTSASKDVQIGQQASREVERQFPILNDYEATRYVQEVGRRLVAAIPSEYQRPEFQYTFKIVNARDINAFALPGGPMYVNRGMIEAARTEGEMAGVMAHELSHVVLRHAIVQQSEANSPMNQILGIGAILGGAILGGQTGAQLGQMVAAGNFMRYSRKYETQADILGAQIMAHAGYDPRDLANMFRTIQRESGGSRAPEWLSSHPDPGNRYATIEREAQMLRVSPNSMQNTAQFARIQNRLRQLPRAPSMEEIERNAKNGQGQGQGTIASGTYESRVAYPSASARSYNLGVATVNAPQNWQVVNQSNTEVWLAPQGAFGNQGITHGTLMGISPGNGGNLQQGTENYVQGILQSNNYLRQQTNYSSVYMGNREGYGIILGGRSPITGRNEIATVYTTQLRNGDLFYVVTVSPESEASTYNNTFRNVIRSLRFTD